MLSDAGLRGEARPAKRGSTVLLGRAPNLVEDVLPVHATMLTRPQIQPTIRVGGAAGVAARSAAIASAITPSI